MKSNSFLFSLFVINVIFLHFLLVILEFIPGSITTLLMLDLVLIVIASPGVILINSLQKNSKGFVGKFLTMTVIQILAFLSLTLILIFNRVEDYKYWVMSFLVLFLLILVAQTFFLLRSMKGVIGKQSENESTENSSNQ